MSRRREMKAPPLSRSGRGVAGAKALAPTRTVTVAYGKPQSISRSHTGPASGARALSALGRWGARRRWPGGRATTGRGRGRSGSSTDGKRMAPWATGANGSIGKHTGRASRTPRDEEGLCVVPHRGDSRAVAHLEEAPHGAWAHGARRRLDRRRRLGTCRLPPPPPPYCCPYPCPYCTPWNVQVGWSRLGAHGRQPAGSRGHGACGPHGSGVSGPQGAGRGGRPGGDETCPVGTEGGTRRVQLVREGGGGGSAGRGARGQACHSQRTSERSDSSAPTCAARRRAQRAAQLRGRAPAGAGLARRAGAGEAGEERTEAAQWFHGSMVPRLNGSTGGGGTRV